MLAYYHYTTSRYRAAAHTPPTPVWDTSRFPTPSSTGACTRTSHATRDSRPYRAAGNRTRSTRTRIVRTTGILRPAICAELRCNSVCTFVSGKPSVFPFLPPRENKSFPDPFLLQGPTELQRNSVCTL